MPRLFAFLRAINVGGHTVTMNALCSHFVALGLRDVESFIASGNVVFTAGASAIERLERRIESKLESALGYPVPTFIRTGDELRALHAYGAFPESERRAAHALMVGLVARKPGTTATRNLLGLAGTQDRFHVHGREIYWLRKSRESDPTLTNARLERVLGTPATFRNANTFARLVDKYGLDSA